MYTNWKRGIKVTLIVGNAIAIVDYALAYLVLRELARSDGASGWSLGPLWRSTDWCFATFVYLAFGSFFGLLAAFHPRFQKQ